LRPGVNIIFWGLVSSPVGPVFRTSRFSSIVGSVDCFHHVGQLVELLITFIMLASSLSCWLLSSCWPVRWAVDCFHHAGLLVALFIAFMMLACSLSCWLLSSCWPVSCAVYCFHDVGLLVELLIAFIMLVC